MTNQHTHYWLISNRLAADGYYHCRCDCGATQRVLKWITLVSSGSGEIVKGGNETGKDTKIPEGPPRQNGPLLGDSETVKEPKKRVPPTVRHKEIENLKGKIIADLVTGIPEHDVRRKYGIGFTGWKTLKLRWKDDIEKAGHKMIERVTCDSCPFRDELASLRGYKDAVQDVFVRSKDVKYQELHALSGLQP